MTVSELVDLTSTAVIAAATVALMVATFLLARWTRKLVETTARAEPLAVIEPNRWAMNHADIFVRNVGSAAAFDIEVTFDPPPPYDRLETHGGIPLRRISVLLPEQEIRSYLAEAQQLIDTRFTVTVSWASKPRATKRQSVTYPLDMRVYKERSVLGELDPLTTVARSLEKLEKTADRAARDAASARNRR